MCDVDFDDHERFQVWSETDVKRARKSHRCRTCGIRINVGDPYRRHFSVTDGSTCSEAQCVHCRAISVAFGESHNFYVSPSYLFTMLSECVADDAPGSDRWQQAVAEIKARAA